MRFCVFRFWCYDKPKMCNVMILLSLRHVFNTIYLKNASTTKIVLNISNWKIQLRRNLKLFEKPNAWNQVFICVNRFFWSKRLGQHVVILYGVILKVVNCVFGKGNKILHCIFTIISSDKQILWIEAAV